MAMSTWVYRKVDGQFLRGGFYDPTFDPAVESVVQFPDADPTPDVRLSRFDAVLGKRLATAPELASYDAAVADTTAAADVDANLVIRAAMIAVLWQALGTPPTGPQIAGMRVKFIATFKALT